MNRIIYTIITLLLCGSAQGASRVNLDSLYRVLDAAIDSADIYLQQKMQRLEMLKQEYATARTAIDRYHAAQKIYTEYIPFENDSAIAYQYRCIDLAEAMGRGDLKAATTLHLAYQLSNSGFYNEARIHLGEVPSEYLKGDLGISYLEGTNNLYGEMGYYSHDPRLSSDFRKQVQEIRASLLTQLDTTSVAWLHLRTTSLDYSDQHQVALRYSDRWMKACTPGTRPYAIMAYYRSEIYKKMGDTEMQRYWLIQSALTDIRNAIMDQGSLWSLANSLISEDQDVQRAHRYIDFSWKCISRFSTHMRSWLVSPVVTHINDAYKQQLRTANNRLRWTIGIISLLLVGILLSLLYVIKKRRQLAMARNELNSLNDQLAVKNEQLLENNTLLQDANRRLSDTNEQLRSAVIHLNDSTRVKDEYIGKFLTICSDYIDKLDNYRIKVNRKLKANQYNDLLRMTSSEQLKEDELQELLENFDAVFLRLFPSFIDDFNALLRKDEKIIPADRNALNTDLRIFALIRLGIDESSKIAEFLHYSPNSIYAYRARIKNKAAGNRDDFERQVKEIGMQQ